MSRAGTKSNQGDDYQHIVALHWLIRLMNDDDGISYIQAESNGIPDLDEKISVDDVVVVYTDGRRRHIQVKKNQPRNRAWSLSDQSLSDELSKIRNQLESNESTVVELYSRTPFGDLQSLAEASREYPDYNAFHRESGERLQATLTTIASKWERSEADSLYLLRRLEFGSSLSFDEWDRSNKRDLEQLVINSDLALPVLESFLNRHQSKIQATTLTIHRDDVIQHLAQKGLVKAPLRVESEILEQFKLSSCIGREWQRTVGGRQIVRVELGVLIQLIDEGANTILVTDRPGSGKTCLLLDLADHLEEEDHHGLLFIKGDRFSRLHTEDDFTSAGLPEDIVGLCGRLSEQRRVVVIIDSLDVLSMNREHGALNVFLRLIDRLKPMRNVTVVAACRQFDLQYDPLLRDREWKHKIHVSDFDYDTVVAPLLREWGIQEGQVEVELRRLLTLPQNLRLFEAIAMRGGPCNIHTAYELYEAYLEEVVVKNPELGTPAMEALQTLAARLLRERTNLIPPATFPGAESVRRALVSNGLLFQDPSTGLGFSHQTLFDNLASYSSLARGEDLSAFIKSHPPFPFLRAAVRSFVFHVRAHAPALFSRQVWNALHDDKIAYHLRRLIAESLAEIIPTDNDWPLLRRMFRQEPELFRRLFWRVEGDAWWRMLYENWLPSLASHASDGEWRVLLITQLERWMNSHPSEVVSLWRQALSEGWGEGENLIWQITIQLHKFQHWQIEGIRELIEILLAENKNNRDILGKVLSLFIEATGQGDDLLWRYIIKDVDVHDIKRFDIGKKLHCNTHVFHDKEFLKKRLTCSDWLLDTALKTIEEWATKEEGYSPARRLRSNFLYSLSWECRHSRHDVHHAGDLEILLNGIEHALKHHAGANDDWDWWQRNEPQLRYAREETLLYFLAVAYKENPEANVDGMSSLLTDAELLRYGHIEHELGEMIQAGYHLLSPETQETNQNIILGLYSDENWDGQEIPIWVHHAIYNYLIWIPTIFRLPESQDFVERFQPQFGTYLPAPNIHSWGGTVGSPVSLENFLKLNDADIFRLLDYYSNYNDHSSHPADFNKGGRDVFERVLSEASAINPARYITLLPALEQQGVQATGYINSLLNGMADHLRYRFGRLRPPQNWKPVEPLPDGETLALYLLDRIEKCSDLRENGYGFTHQLEACCEVLTDLDSAERLTFQLFRFVWHPDPEEERQRIFSQGKQGISTEDLRTDAINSVRGIAAGCAISLYNNLLEKELKAPELFFPLLRHYARDPVGGVRAAILDHLPYLTSKCHASGWQLFHDVFRETQTHLWPLSEQHLYYQYHECFDEVAPYLERMRIEAPDEAGESWGRIATLATLSGHIEDSNLFHQLESMSLPSAWLGASQVFAANLNQHLDLCVKGLRRIFHTKNLDKGIYRSIEHAFNPKNHGRLLNQEVARDFISTVEAEDHGLDLHIFLDWIADLAGRDPIAALDICERLTQRISELESPHQIWHTEPLIAALSSILREADETDDPVLISRAVRLQDQFLRMDIYGMADYFKHTDQC